MCVCDYLRVLSSQINPSRRGTVSYCTVKSSFGSAAVTKFPPELVQRGVVSDCNIMKIISQRLFLLLL